MSKKKRFWNFIYNAASGDENEVDLRLSGYFIDSEDVWIYEWLGIPAASPNLFRKELAEYAGKNITVWIDSRGGSVFAGVGVFNALMEHKKTGGKVKTIAEKAMSAATLPYMAGDEKLISPGGMIMVHNPLVGFEGLAYASELRQAADMLDEVKEAIINIYQLGTGLSRPKISELMDNETYMSAQRAINEKFADDILYSLKTEIIDKQGKVMNFTFNRLAVQNVVNDSFKKFFEIAKNNRLIEELEPCAIQEPAVSAPVANINQKTKEVENVDLVEIKNIDELRAAYPELVAQIETAARNEGAQAERERIKGIEAIAKNIDPALVNKAKYDTPMDARDLAFKAMQGDLNKGQEYINAAIADNTASGVNNVKATPVDGQGANSKPMNIADKFKNIAAALDAKRRGVKVE